MSLVGYLTEANIFYICAKASSHPVLIFLSSSQKSLYVVSVYCILLYKKAQVGLDQEKAQSERDSHSKN